MAVALVACSGGHDTPATSTAPGARPGVKTIPHMPPVTDASNIYAAAGAGMVSAAAKTATPLVYVPGHATNNVTVIDPTTLKVIAVVPVGPNPQHVVPAYDMRRLWVANNADHTSGSGSLTAIDPVTGDVGVTIEVEDPYNLYFTPDGAYALVVAEAERRLDFRDPVNMSLEFSISTPECHGINHIDFSAAGSYLVATCEDNNSITKVDWIDREVVATLSLGADAMPQDIRLGPNGETFYVADMMGDRLLLVDGESFTRSRAVALGPSGGFGAHGLYPSRDGTRLYVANRGSDARGRGPRHGKGSVSVVDFATNEVVGSWPVPGGGSPDMGGVSADGTRLWLSGRFDDEVYVFDTVAGKLEARIPIGPAGAEPHGLCVWPQPGRYSLGHTGNTR
jgi:YVTN family beta-propeller protein